MKIIQHLILPGILYSCLLLFKPEIIQAQVSQVKQDNEGKTPLLSKYSWHTFEGSIGNKPAQISLYLFEDKKTLKGNYVIGNGTKVPLTGQVRADSLLLSADQPAIRLRGIVAAGSDTSRDHVAGIITSQEDNTTVPFYGALSSITSGSFDHRYSDMLGTADEVEAFMKQVQTAILKDDRKWLSAHMAYPVRSRSGRKRLTANNRQQFEKLYAKFVTPQLKEKIKDVPTTNLFHKLGRAMLADGAVWIANTRNSTEQQYDFVIIALN